MIELLIFSLKILVNLSFIFGRGTFISSGSCYNAFICMLLYFIAFVRLQPIAVRRGERPKRGRPTLSHNITIQKV